MNVLERLEAKIDAHYSTMQDARRAAQRALYQIREGELWSDVEESNGLPKYESFVDYCEKRWGYKRSQAYMIADQGQFLVTCEDHEIERPQPKQAQLKKLRKIKGDGEDVWRRRADAWNMTVETYGEDIDPATLEEVLLQQQFITPRAKRHHLDAGDRKDREQERELQRINRALETLANASFTSAYALKRFGAAKVPHLGAARRKWLK